MSPLSSRLLPFERGYDVVLRFPEKTEGCLKLVEVGADGNELPLDFDSAQNEAGEKIKFSNGVSIETFKFGEIPIRINLGMSSFLRKAVKAYVVTK